MGSGTGELWPARQWTHRAPPTRAMHNGWGWCGNRIRTDTSNACARASWPVRTAVMSVVGEWWGRGRCGGVVGGVVGSWAMDDVSEDTPSLWLEGVDGGAPDAPRTRRTRAQGPVGPCAWLSRRSLAGGAVVGSWAIWWGRGPWTTRPLAHRSCCWRMLVGTMGAATGGGP